MRRILGSFVLLASALFVAGCGSSTSNSQDNGLLSGQYAFQEQVYTFFGAGRPVSAQAPAAWHGQKRRLTAVAKVPNGGHSLADVYAHREQARHAVPSAIKRVVPHMGDLIDNVAWGASVGSLTFDGNGHITAGEIDFNEPFGFGYFSDPVTGTYSVDNNRVGVISLTSTNGDGDEYNYQITLEGATTAATGFQMLESETDDVDDIVQIGSGAMLLQTAGQTQSTLNGNYVFGVQGQTCYGSGCTQSTTGDLFAAGVLAADGAGTFGTTGEADIATGFDTDNAVTVSGTYGAPDSNGRSTATLTATNYTQGALPAGYVIYTANASTAFLLSTDQSSSTEAAALLYGEMNAQSGTFGSTSLAGNYVVGETTEDLQNQTNPDTFSDAFVGLLTASGGTASGTADENHAGTVSSGVALNYGAYTVAANGRVTFTGGTDIYGRPRRCSI